MNSLKKRRGNRAGTLIKKPNGVFLAKWTYKGKVFYKSTGCDKRSEAEEVLEKLTRPFRDQTDIEVINNIEAKIKSAKMVRDKNDLMLNGIKIEDLVDAYVNDIDVQDLSRYTVSNRTYTLKKFVDWCKAEYPSVGTIDKVTEFIANAYLIYMSKSVGASTYNTNLITLKCVWNKFGRNGNLFANVWKGFKMRTRDAKSMRRDLTVEEIRKLISVCKNDDERLLICIGCYTGMRIGDCATLKWDEIDLDKRIIIRMPLKTKKFLAGPLMIPIHNVLYEGLMYAKKKVDEDEKYVLPAICRKYKTNSLNYTIAGIFKRADIKISVDVNGKKKVVTGFHSLRRFFISMAINQGMNPFLVQKIVGHTDIEMTEYYYNVNEDLLKKGVGKLPEFMLPNINGKMDYKVDEKSKKEEDELNELLDSMFDENGKPIVME